MATTTRRIGPADHGRRMAWEAYIEADFEEGWLYELARGVIDVTEVPDPAHGRIIGRLAHLFFGYEDKNPRAIDYRASGAECRIWLPGLQSSRRPDQAIYLLPQPPGDSQPWARWIPNIVAEVIDRGSEERDYVEKREEYLRVGVTEYWILDPQRQQLLILQRYGDIWKEVVIRPGMVYRTSVLPGLEVRPEELLGSAEDA